MTDRHSVLRSRRSQRGVSLVELMIAVTLGLMVLATLATVFANSSRSRTELDRLSRQIENGRFAMEIMTDDLRLAGFYGEFPVNEITAPPPVAGDPLTMWPLPDPCSNDPNVWRKAMLVSVQAWDNGIGVPFCVPQLDLKPGSDVFVVRRVATCEAGVDGCPGAAANRPYIQVSKCSSKPLEETATTLYRLGYGMGSFGLHAANCVDPANPRQYLVHIYYISVNNGQGQQIPTLTRMEFDGVQYAIVPLVEGIEELNIEWGVNNNNSGSPDLYLADPSPYAGYPGCTSTGPSTTCAGAADTWRRVVTAKITLLARNTEASNNYTDQKTYTLGLDASGIPITKTYNDGYRRHVYTSTVRLVNIADRKDVP